MAVRDGRTPPKGGWWPEVALLAGFVVLTLGLLTRPVQAFDLAIRDWCLGHQAWAAHAASRALYFVGSANVLAPVALIPATVVAWRARSWRPYAPIVVVFLSSYLFLGPIKVWLHRGAPKFRGPGVELFSDPNGLSYPSGHAANTLIWFQVFALLLAAALRLTVGRELPGTARTLLRVLPPVIVSVTITYLSYHWVTDTVAGLMLGFVLDRVLRRVRWGPPLLPGAAPGDQSSRTRFPARSKSQS